MYVFYPDVYGCMQWMVNVFAIKSTMLFWGIKSSLRRLLGITFLGAVIETILVMLLPSMELYSIIVHSIVMPMMTFTILLPCSVKQFVKEWLTMYLAAFVLSGSVEWIFTQTNWSGILLTGVCAILLYAMLWGMAQIKHRKPELCHVTLTSHGKKLQAIGMYDTGNVLRDPIWGQPITLGDRELLLPIMEQYDLPMLPVTFHTAAGAGMMDTLVVEQMEVYVNGRTCQFRNARIGIASNEMFQGRSYQLLIHKEHTRT